MDQSLRQLFEPQLAQMHARSCHHCSDGLVAEAYDGWSRGRMANVSPTEGCLVNFLDLVVSEDYVLREYPIESICLCVGSRDSAAYSPVSITNLRASGNVAAFSQDPGETKSFLGRGERIRSTSLCLTPDFFRRNAAIYGRDFSSVKDELSLLDPNDVNEELRGLLARMGTWRLGRTDQRPTFERDVHEEVGRFLSWADETVSAQSGGLSWEDLSLVREARRIIDAAPSGPPSVEQIARATHCGHTRLCAVFKHVTGQTLGNYARGSRMRRARSLLAEGRMPVAEVARAVGYSTPAAFSSAFRRETGLSPTAWRTRA